VDRLASPLHRPTTHSRMSRREGLPTRRCLVLSRRWVAVFGGGGGRKLPGAPLSAGSFVLSGTLVSGGGEMDALLECTVPGACGFLLLRLIVVGA
jgi:hypothetical protein